MKKFFSINLLTIVLLITISISIISTTHAETNTSTSVLDFSLSIGSQGSEVEIVQDNLIKLGYLTGVPDGNFGNYTYSAVRYFQEWINQRYGEEMLPTTGECTLLTMALLDYWAKNTQDLLSTPTHSPTPEPTIQPTPTHSPTPEPTIQPTPTYSPTVTEVPNSELFRQAEGLSCSFTLAGETWSLDEFQNRINELFEYQVARGAYRDGISFYAVYTLTDNNAHFFQIYCQDNGQVEMTEECIIVTDGQVGLATTDSASITLEEIVIALAFGGIPDTMSTVIFRGQAKNNNWRLNVDNKEFRYFEGALQLLIVER